jgi:hypothetical protein
MRWRVAQRKNKPKKNHSPEVRDKPDGCIFEKWEGTNYSYLHFCSEGSACVFCRKASLLSIINLTVDNYQQMTF